MERRGAPLRDGQIVSGPYRARHGRAPVEQRPYDGGVIEVREGPDRRRPRNVWPRLIAGAVFLLAAIALGVTCFAAVSSNLPDRELRFEFSELQPGAPRFEPVTDLGSDRLGFTYGAWVVRLDDGSVVALLSRDVASACGVEWRPNALTAGVFADRCGGSEYSLSGDPLSGDAARSLDRLPVTLRGGKVIVDLERLELGACRVASSGDCSGPDGPVTRALSGRLSRLPGAP